MLRRLAADFVGFQELWAEEALYHVIEGAGLKDTHTALVPPDHAGNGIVCAGAVRSDMLVADPEWITDFPRETVLRSTGDDPRARR